MQELKSSPLQALRSVSLVMAGTQRRTSFGKVFDLNSSGGTTASPSPSMLDQEPKASKPAAVAGKEDDSYATEYYARAQLANAKLVRQYKTRIEELKRSSFPSIAYYLRLLMHTSGKLVGYTIRRLSWAEMCLVSLLMLQIAPWVRPYVTPSLHAMRNMIISYLLALRRNSLASMHAAVAADLASMAAMISTQSTTDDRGDISAQIVILKEQLAQARAITAASTPVETSEPAVLSQSKLVMVVGNHLEWLLASINRKPIYLVACCL